jgi:hypothetical protein
VHGRLPRTKPGGELEWPHRQGHRSGESVRVDGAALGLEAGAHGGVDRRAKGKKSVDRDGVSRNAEREEHH